MTDVTPTEEAPVEESQSLPPEVQSQLDEIRAEKAARLQAALDAQEAEDQRCAKLNAAKEKCTSACGSIGTLIEKATDPNEREALIELQQRTHAAHEEELKVAYREFAGQVGETASAPPGVVQITSHSSSGADTAATATT